MKNWKKQWQNELDSLAPKMSKRVRQEPIAVDTTQQAQNAEPEKIAWYHRVFEWLKLAFFSSPKRIAAFASVCAVAALSIGLGVGLGGQNQTVSTSMGAVSVQINPSAVFRVDKKGKVAGVTAMNADADVVLSNAECTAEMEGEPIAEAVKIFVDHAARLGYLNLSQTGAIRVTSCTDAQTMEIVGDCLQGYFCEKGAYIAVVEERLEVAEFAQSFGFSADSAEGLQTELAARTSYYASRETELSEKTLSDIYYEQVEKTGIESIFSGILQTHIESLRQNRSDVYALQEQADVISNHKDNPMLLFVDYWTLKAMNLTYSAALQAEMDTMTELLAAYKQKYGVDIVGASDLRDAVRKCDALPWEELLYLVENFTTELFERYADAVTELLQNIGVDVSKLGRLYQAPTTWEEYVQKMREYLLGRYQAMQTVAKDVYEAVRERISAADYDKYIQNIVAEYGSLVDYWQALRAE